MRALRAIGALLVALALPLAAMPIAHAETRAVVFVVDTSGSMQGTKLTAAKNAVTSLVDVIPADVSIGLVTFASTSRVAVTPTLSRPEMRSALKAMSAGGNTALIDAVLTGLDLAKIADKGAVIVVSDGADTVSRSKIAAVEKADWGQRQLSIVGVEFDFEAVRAQFAPTVERTGGLLISVDEASLLAEALQSSLEQAGVVPTAKPSIAPEQVTIVLDPQRTRIGAALAIAAGLSLAFVLISVTVIGFRRRRFLAQQQVIETYTKRARPKVSTKSERNAPVLFKKSQAALALRLDAANIEITPSRFRWIQVGLFVLLLLTLRLLGLVPILAFLIALGVAAFMPGRFLKRRQRKLHAEFQSELPDFLAITASALRAGLPVTQAIETAAKESAGELGRQMSRALREMSMGTALDTSLSNVAERVDSDDFAWLVTALEVQRRVGGNLSGILDVAAATVRARLALQQEIKTLAAEGLLSAQVLAALPLGMMAFLSLTRFEFISPLFTTTPGLVVLALALGLMASGYQWIKRLSTFEV